MCPYLVHLNKVAWKFIQKVYERLLVVKREGKLLNNVTTYIHKHWPVTDSFIANTSALCLSFLIYRYLQISIISFFQYLFVFQYVIAYLLYIVYSALHFVYHSNHCNNGWFMNSIIGIYLIWLVVAHVTILALAVSKHTFLCVCFLVWKYHWYGFSYTFCYGFTCWILHTVHLICGVTVHKFIWLLLLLVLFINMHFDEF